ncbi:hypothetical protein [Pseudoalteromonas luteoviolacea]|uniref:Uncharacterized protein n=1 Tax=Pseudoalteromonas luteoviolacea S4054 TaxID=1129367 RepID=A0A0F6AIG2_9GAMM|nr:hypothetical protein [Pseudoalteromonas luteoviolacea]AOT07284.1 hypothetical protein S4054249_05205 [Pseudoalteromonas luteoviolacea]AOT12199.1 hypothetical protein S40542_05205 [Pseudoalteromonas luteoviolacea]AOT17112.1 hypothetical protein S4054_05205 [Pseudoalteromonas luteoviolacea]KKE85696.1 hypothetical protein N479_25020 [Pseudoalteromonas luteoviolacea S4054]KZN70965.1 hypothetical protein N481_20495 [Pseudoalteromonas luteoviolacea S4047-1]
MNDSQPKINELQQAYSAAKRHHKMSPKQVRKLKRLSRLENRKHTRQFWLRTSLWASSCCLVALVGSLSLQNILYDFEVFLAQLEPNSFSAQQYDIVETHNIVEGSYQTTIAQQKTQLDEALTGSKEKLLKISQFYGKLVHSQEGVWFIADCNNQTLIEVRESLLNELIVPEERAFDYQQGQLLALSKNQSGQLINITAPSSGKGLYACP